MRRLAVRAAQSVAALLAATSTLSAHPGHGTTPGGSAVHYLVEPVHATPLLAVGAVCVVILAVARNRRAS